MVHNGEPYCSCAKKPNIMELLLFKIAAPFFLLLVDLKVCFGFGEDEKTCRFNYTFEKRSERVMQLVTGYSPPIISPVIVHGALFNLFLEWLKRCRILSGAMDFFFGKPDRSPPDRGGKAERGSRKTIDPEPENLFSSGYILAQFFAGIFVTLILLFYFEAFPLWLIFFYSLWAIWFISMAGVLLKSDHRNVFPLEIIKLFSFPTMMFFLFWGNYLTGPVIPLLVLGFAAGCFSSLLRAAKK